MKLRDKNIFIVEDNAKNRVVYTMVLQIAGASLQFDVWGRDVVHQLQMSTPDLIVLDLMLGKHTDGFEVYEKIRQLPEFASIPIVAISASDPSTTLPKCQELGFSGFIAKPIEPQLLVDQVSRLIDGEEVWYLGERYGGEIKPNV